MFESKGGILFIGGLGFFAFAFLSNALVPILMFRDLPETPLLAYETQEDGTEVAVGLAAENRNAMKMFQDLQQRYPEQFEKYFGQQATVETLADALRLGRQVYVGEACWHCHSQFVRPVSNESERWGPVSETWEYQNELQRPVLFGTRRVGPDLSREGGRRANDWHAVHFFEPTLVSVGSPMPNYPWLFDRATYVGPMKEGSGDAGTEGYGPNGGHRVDLGSSTYSAEWFQDDDAHSVTIVILDASGGREVPIAADEVYVDVTAADGKQAEYTLPALPQQATERRGENSRFQLANEALLAALNSEGTTIELRIELDRNPANPNKRGLALITYVQWLGSWLDSYPYYEESELETTENY